MANMIDYIRWRGDIPLWQVPLGEVDALILSYLAYMPFDDIVPAALTAPGISLRDAAREAFKLYADRSFEYAVHLFCHYNL